MSSSIQHRVPSSTIQVCCAAEGQQTLTRTHHACECAQKEGGAGAFTLYRRGVGFVPLLHGIGSFAPCRASQPQAMLQNLLRIQVFDPNHPLAVIHCAVGRTLKTLKACI